MAIVDMSDYPLRKAQQLASEGSASADLARKDEERLLAALVGQGDMVNLHHAYPGNPVQGLWDSLNKASDDRIPNDPLKFIWEKRNEVAVMDGRECSYPRTIIGIAVDPNLKHLADSSLNFVAFENAGRKFVKIFGSYRQGRKEANKSMLYEKAGKQRINGREVDFWRRSNERDGNLNNSSETREEFFINCFKRNVALHNVLVDEFNFLPDPKRRQPEPIPFRRKTA